MSKPQRELQDHQDTGSSLARQQPGVLGLLTLIGIVAILLISLASWRDVARLEERMTQIEAKLRDTGRLSGSLPTRAASARRGPDPNRVYTVKTNGAPVRGKSGAPVVIAEFSDYQ